MENGELIIGHPAGMSVDCCFSLDFSPFGRRPKGSASELRGLLAVDKNNP